MLELGRFVTPTYEHVAYGPRAYTCILNMPHYWVLLLCLLMHKGSTCLAFDLIQMCMVDV